MDSLPPTADRPHTISTTYEKGHQRPPLTVYTFQNPETIHESSSSGSLIQQGTGGGGGGATSATSSGQNTPATQKSPAASLSRPPLPVVSICSLTMKLCLLFLLIVIVVVVVYRLRCGNVEAGTCGKWQRERERENRK